MLVEGQLLSTANAYSVPKADLTALGQQTFRNRGIQR